MKVKVTQTFKLTVKDLSAILAKHLDLPTTTVLSPDYTWVSGYGGDDIKSFSGVTLTFDKETEVK